MSEEKELVWVPKEKATQLKAAESENAQMAIIDDIIAKTKRSMRIDLEALDEDVLVFKGTLLQYKKAYSEALNAHLDATYKLWEDIDSKLPNMRSKAEKTVAGFAIIAPELQKVSDTIDGITRKIESVNAYQLKNMVELIETIQNADNKTRDILAKVLGATK